MAGQSLGVAARSGTCSTTAGSQKEKKEKKRPRKIQKAPGFGQSHCRLIWVAVGSEAAAQKKGRDLVIWFSVLQSLDRYHSMVCLPSTPYLLFCSIRQRVSWEVSPTGHTIMGLCGLCIPMRQRSYYGTSIFMCISCTNGTG